jgi:hypothetical protein
MGETGLGLVADANDDQVVDDADYQIWKANFGVIAASTTAVLTTSVPEPHTISLALVASLGFMNRRRPAKRS